MMIALALIPADNTFCQEIYQKGLYQIIRSNPDVPLISSFNVKTMAAKYLPEFPYSYGMDVHYGYRLFHFGGIGVAVGLLPNVREAEEVILDGLNESNMAWQEWPSEWNKVGDSAWYNRSGIPEKGNISYYISGVTFIRKNAIVKLVMGPNYGPDFRAIAEAIDHDILAGTDYLKIEDKISPPVVTSINLPKQTLKEGEWTYFTFEAYDPSGSALKYFSNGLYEEKLNSWRYAAFRSLFPLDAPFEGPHAIKCWVVNENNLFSSIKEVTITF